MGKGAYSVTNLAAASGTTLSVSGSADPTNYPTSFLVDNKPSPMHKLSAKTGAWLKLDFGSAQTMKVAALLNHDLTSAATVKFQANSSDSWGAPPVDQTLTYRSPHIFYVFNQSYRWARFTIDDSGNSYYPAVGELWVGTYTQFTRNFNWPQRGNEGRVASLVSQAGVRSGFRISDVQQYGLAWSALKAAEYAEVKALYDGTQSGTQPFLFLPDVDGTEVLFCLCASAIAYSEGGPSLYKNVTLPLIEQANGIQI